MRLKHIKLAGFKSFVDPTKVPFEQQMTAIVGPNGCGKSNIIDAVRWVLGESSAKNLRGDAMTDVIFNGASTRKSVGQASVELLFDNMSARIQGSMADRNQVSIRRVVNRDSQNSYFLNGTKCRRKDITDIFLGTGLGPRSYAIIEQGTISRLIESKPQELRVFIEEAAGISKYKERRRDTEIRIRHTRENLERLFDIRSELNVQIDKLHQQAEAAKRFKTLKSQERTIKAELAVLRWQKFDQQFKSKQALINRLEQQITQKELQQKTDEIALFSAKQSFQTANQKIQTLQQQKIVLTNDTARLEQNIKHLTIQQKKLADDKQVNQQQMSHAQQSLCVEQEQLKIHRDKLDDIQPQYQRLVDKIACLEKESQHSNEQLILQQQAWKSYHQQQQLRTEQQLEQTRNKARYHEIIEQKKSRLAIVLEQLSILIKENAADDGVDINALNHLNAQIAQLQNQQKNHENTGNELAKTNYLLNQKKSELSGTRVSLAKQIEQLQDKLLHQEQWQSEQTTWLADNGIHKTSLLQDTITIEQGWELAVEMVLSHRLQAPVIEEHQLKNLCLVDLPHTLLLNKVSTTPSIISSKKDTLATKVTGEYISHQHLNTIRVVDNYQDALALLPQLNDDESVISPQGIWLSHQFIRKGVLNEKNDHFTDVNLLSELKQQLSDVIQQQEAINGSISSNEAAKQTSALDAEKLASQLHEKQQELSQIKQAEAVNKQKKSSIVQQQHVLQNEQHSLEKNILDTTALIDELSTRDQRSVNGDLSESAMLSETQLSQSQLSETNKTIDALAENVHLLQQQVQSQQAQQKTLNQEKHQCELSMEKSQHALTQCQQSIVRFQESIKQLTEQQKSNNALLDNGVAPMIEDEQQLQTYLAEMTLVDQQLVAEHEKLTIDEKRIQSIEQKQRCLVEEINELKVSLNQQHLDRESHRLKAQNALEQLNELGQEVNLVQQAMPKNARESQWQAQLIKLAKDIQLLGAINLAAIDEFETQLTRKNYLDQQDQDLNLAISTLESAIEKIDKESRHKFKTTFDKVNQDLQSLFPKVFGGGQAYLNLTGEDLLDTGVTIMARPPGKKNSTIHLLSGGEKALTALSLVFAIFRLNPAPFCMLDEVDAPLDDANVSRFCNLVKEMSKTVQFIYISHNKIAMEMASQLTGVTMFEAGVSRMVAVDIDEAVAMAEVS
ncbi:chromosome segregation protein SMC [Colwelliaceae bacterium 6441]